MKTKRVAHRIYQTTYNGRTYEIDGQNREDSSKEWDLYDTTGVSPIWIDTYTTKREALADIPTLKTED